MAKKLSDVLKGTNRSRIRPGRTGDKPGVDYASRMPDERNFVSNHDTEEFDDRVGNGSDVYSASNVGRAELERHGHVPDPQSHAVYKQHNEEAVETSPRPKRRPTAPSSSPRPQPRPTVIGSTRGEESPTPGVYEPTTRGTGVVREENQVGEEKEMMKRQLHFIKYAADEIMEHVDKTDDPEEWFQNKLAGLYNSIKGLHAYIEGDKRLEGDKEMPQIPNMKNEEAEGDERVQPKDTRGKKNLRMITGEVKESNNGSPKRTASEQARDRFDKKQERKEMRQEREENDN